GLPTIAVTGSPAALTEDENVVAGEIGVGGTVTLTDEDTADTLTLTHALTGSEWTGGDLTEDQLTALTAGFASDGGAGTWDYSVANADLQFLGAGETVTLTFTLTVDDGT